MDYHIVELVDGEDHVRELRFMQGDDLYRGVASAAARVRFEYTDSTIVETAYYADGSPVSVEAGLPFRITYRLNGRELLSCHNEFTPLSLGEDPIVEDAAGPEECGYIPYYLYSRSKMDGVNPVADKFDWSTVRLPYDEAILSEGDYDL